MFISGYIWCLFLDTFDVYFWIHLIFILDTFDVHFGYIWCSYWNHFCSILDTFLVHFVLFRFKVFLTQSQVHYEAILCHLWQHFFSIFGFIFLLFEKWDRSSTAKLSLYWIGIMRYLKYTSLNKTNSLPPPFLGWLDLWDKFSGNSCPLWVVGLSFANEETF